MYLKYLDTKDLTPFYTHDLVKIVIKDSGIYSDQIKGKKCPLRVTFLFIHKQQWKLYHNDNRVFQ